MNRSPVTGAESVLPPKKQFLTEEQLDEVWEMRGMKFRIDEFHKALLDRGLVVSVDREVFRTTMFNILKMFMVDGDARRDPRMAPRPTFPKMF